MPLLLLVLVILLLIGGLPTWGSFVWLCALGRPHDPPDYPARLCAYGPPKAVTPGVAAHGFAVPVPLWEGAASCLAAPIRPVNQALSHY